MKLTESILGPKKNLKGGARLPHRKGTAECQSVEMPTPKTVSILMSQHIGAPCEPTVKKGDTVYVGTVVGNSDAYVSAPIHSSVSGVVTEIKQVRLASGATTNAVVIESDGLDTVDPAIKPIEINTKQDLINAAKDCGLVGLGGAGFPAHVKLNIKDGAEYDTLIINGAECEPYITSDYRECMENYDDVMNGIYLIKEVLGFKHVVIGVEDNKPKAIKKLYDIAADKRDADNSVRLMKLKSSYPQGAEKVLIYTTTGRVLKMGQLPIDVGCVVMNITSVGTLYRYIKTGMPLVKKRLTVDGDAIKEPKNVIVPIGTSVGEVIDFCGGFSEEPEKVLFGGPMMGIAINNLSMAVTKHNNAILAFKPHYEQTTACIRCGRCVGACPMNLAPAAVETALKLDNVQKLEALNVNYCMECGSCAFVCPAKRPLTQTMRLAKAEVKRRGSK
ncbi:MAG: electron transport complex subunit RsxC [Clostridia bacterium]|nr:electron transport complex subunit RsxC [Clostridia bacterium]